MVDTPGRYNPGAPPLAVGAFAPISLDAQGRVQVVVVQGGASFAMQGTWNINAAAGNDANDGATPSTALQTLGQWAARMGTSTINIPMTVDVVGDLLASDTPRNRIQVGPTGSIAFRSTPSVVYASHGTSVVIAANPATNVAWQLQDPNLNTADWTPYISTTQVVPYRVRMISGAAAGAIVVPLKDLGAKNARVCSPFTIDPTLGVFGQSLPAIATGDQFQIEKLASLGDHGLEFSIDPSSTGSLRERVTFEGFAFGNGAAALSIANNDAGYGTQIGFYGCAFGPLSAISAGDFLGCRFAYFSLQGTGYVFGGASSRSVSLLSSSGAFVDFEHALQGGSIEVFDNAGEIGSCQIWDAQLQGAVVVHNGASLLAIQAFAPSRVVFGSSAGVACGFRALNGAYIYYDNITGLTLVGSGGAGAAVQIGTVPTNKTYAALPFNDTTKNAGMIVE